MKKEPNSAGFWRRNSIDALTESRTYAPPADPEAQARQRADSQELQQHRTHEAAVKARHARMQLTRAVRIAEQLQQFDGLSLDRPADRRKLAVWINGNFAPKG